MELKGSKTEANLKAAFAGESEARNKYTYFASVAKKEGYEQIAALFLETAENEKEQGIKNELTDKTVLQLEEYFDGKRKEFDIPIKLLGTEFQKKVWNELLKIPYGKTVSYKDISIKIGNPNACRAVGMANHNNPILIIVPCHRVINENKKHRITV